MDWWTHGWMALNWFALHGSSYSRWLSLLSGGTFSYFSYGVVLLLSAHGWIRVSRLSYLRRHFLLLWAAQILVLRCFSAFWMGDCFPFGGWRYTRRLFLIRRVGSFALAQCSLIIPKKKKKKKKKVHCNPLHFTLTSPATIKSVMKIVILIFLVHIFFRSINPINLSHPQNSRKWRITFPKEWP